MIPISERSAFFDATAGDRSYDAAAFSRVFESLVSRDGIVAGTDDELAVVASDPAAMTVEVGLGVAWIQGRYYQLYSAAEVLTVPAADVTNPRIDRVVIRLDLSASGRTISVEYLEGTPASSPSAPSLTRSSETWELSLAQIAVAANETEITNVEITDERDDEILCGFTRVPNADLASDVARANLLTNGGFEIWQRGAGPFATQSAYTADRWKIFLAGTSTISVSRDNTNQDTGSEFCAAVTYTHNVGSNLNQIIEDHLQFRGKTITLSMRVKTATASAVRLAVTDGVSSQFSSYHSGGGAYETLSVSITVASNASTLEAQASFEASATVHIDNAMLVVGSVPADYVPLHPADDLARCQRYYEIHGGANGGHPAFLAYAGAGSLVLGVGVGFSAHKAATPTVTKNGTWIATNCGQPSVSLSVLSGYRIQATSSAAGVIDFRPDSADDSVTAESNP